MERAIILAAGKGQRLVNGLPFPKPLTRVGGVPLIVRVLRNLERYGVQHASVVVGHQEQVLRRGVERHDFDLELSFVSNPEHDGPDGISLLAARDHVTGPTLLVMGDTLLSPELLAPLVSYPLDADRCVAAVDFDIEACIERDSAVKVSLDGEGVSTVGKHLDRFDAIATGAYAITPSLFDVFDATEPKSLVAGFGALALRGKLDAVSVGTARWIDVDTRAAHAVAERSLARYGEALQPTPMVAGL